MRRTTTSCSALALFLLVTVASFAQSRGPSDLRLFPVLPAWNLALDRVVTAPPAFAGHEAFFAVEHEQVAAFDLGSGEPLWTADAAPLSTPAISGDLIFLAERDRITALRRDSGVLAWRLPFAGELAVPLVWDNSWLVAADVAGNVLAFRADDGTLIWRASLGVPVHAAPALAADRVYVPLEDGRVVALEVSDGTQVWERRLGGPPNDMLALDDRIYVGSDDNFFYCLLASNGDVAWRWRTGGDVIGVPVVDDHRVYFVSRDNVLRGLDRKSGSQRWKRALPGRPTRGPVRAADLLLVSGLAPRLNAYAMKDGTPAGEIATPGEMAAAPFITDVHGLPQVVLIARDVAKGTRVLAFRRLVDPPMNTPMPVLPGAITIAKPGSPGDPTLPPGATATESPAAATPR